MNITEFKNKIDPLLDQFLHGQISQVSKITQDEVVRQQVQYVRQVVMGGGKRVRPYVCWLMYLGAGGNELETRILDVGMAIELFHNFCLIHDDVIDRSSLRHGTLPVHSAVKQSLEQMSRVGDLGHVGNAQAVLIGDLLFGWVYRVLAAIENVSVRMMFEEMINEVIVGQMLDVDFMTRTGVEFEGLNEKIDLKTARYTFVQPMRMGALLAGLSHSDTVFSFIEQFGTHLGLAYQIQDDYLDISGGKEQLGKSTFTDLREREHTHFTQYIIANGSDSQKQELGEYFGKELTPAQAPVIRRLFEESGAIAYGKGLIKQHLSAVYSSLEGAQLPQEVKEWLNDLVVHIEQRSK